MKKSLLSLAVLAAFSGAAFAQSSVTVYGLVDMGIVHESGGAAGSVTKLENGVRNGTRLGFRGTEDLGGGLAANFVLETGISADTGGFNQGGLAFGRQSYVGLSGNFGTVKLGRQYSPLFQAVDSIDPFGTGLAGASTNIMIGQTRMNNAMNYSTPEMGGFSAQAAYGFGEVAGDTAKSRALGFSVGYANGPAKAVLAYHNTNNAADTNTTKNTILGGSFNFGVATAYLAFAANKDDTAVYDNRDALIGVSAPFGASTLLASYIRHDDRTVANKDANQVAVGYAYAMSKRTNFYTSYAHISNDNGAAFAVGNATGAGSGNKGFNVGLQHRF